MKKKHVPHHYLMKTNLWNKFFDTLIAEQCSLINSGHFLLPAKIRENIQFSIFSTEDILKVINNLDSNKVHGHS